MLFRSDLIWFGIIIGINLQTSFLTPPFGFALFYLRSIAPKKEWKDEVTGRLLPAVKTLEIYKGAIPYIIIQFAIIILVIMNPGLVTHYKGDKEVVDPNTIEIVVPSFGGALDGQTLGAPGGLGLPPLGLGLPGSNQNGGTLQLPGLSLDGPLNLGGEPPVVNPAPQVDLSQPPVIE